VNLPDLDLIVTAINIQHEVGGNLATILETISSTIRERMRIQGEIRVMTTQQRMTGYVLTLLPFGLGMLMYIINPKYMSRLFTPGWTLIIPLGAVVMVFIGFLVIRKIVAIEV
jgi:tight adherence protein B